MSHRVIVATALASASFLSISTAALAEDVISAEATAESAKAGLDEAGTGLDDIVVVGEKRETSLQRAPLAITAISAGQMQTHNMNELNDLNGYVPGLTIAKEEGGFRIASIRGVGYETHQNPNSAPGVAFHINGVYIAHPMSLAQTLLDVDHIEVLRGPQGTVFGQTSTGGAINVITKKPVIGDFSASLTASYGNYNYAKAGGTVNLGISDVLAFRASVEYFHRDGYAKSIAVPNIAEYDLDDANDLGARAALLFEPSDRFSAVLSTQIFDADRNAEERKNILDPNPDPRVVSQDYPGIFKLKTRMVDLQMSLDLGDVATLKSITAYQYLWKNQTLDNDGLNNPTNFVNNVYWVDRSKTWSQEFALNSQPGGPIEWTAGGLYIYQRGLKDIVQTSSIGTNSNAQYRNVSFAQFGPFQHRSWAGYGQAVAQLSDQLSVTGGIRYSWDKIWAQPITNFNTAGQVRRDVTSDAWTGKLSLDYKITPDNLVYALASRGYKPAAINFNTAPVFVPGFAEKETVWSAEIGTKNDFLDKTIRLNASGYYYWYKNFQYTAEDPRPFNSGTDNLPTVRIYGIEIESSILPMTGLRFDSNISLQKGEIRGDYFALDGANAIALRRAASIALGLPQPYQAGYQFNPAVIAFVAANTANVNGNNVPKLPEFQGTFATQYDFERGPGKWSLRGEMVRRSKFNARIFRTNALDEVPGYTTFNLFASFRPTGSDYSFSISALNITDKDGVNSIYTDPFGAGTTTRQFINPRQIFGTVTVKF
jgi:iron complex outermembrane receptor protein